MLRRPTERGDAMCPFCLASVGLIVASATSAGGLTALAVKLSRKKGNARVASKQPTPPATA
jgi:hypothetical protein